MRSNLLGSSFRRELESGKSAEVPFLHPSTTEAMLLRSLPAGGHKVQGVAGQAVGDVATNVLALSSGIAPVADSQALGWSDIYAALVHESPHNTQYGAASVFWVTMPLTGHFARRRLNGEDEERAQDPYAVNIVSPGSNKIIELDQRTENLHFFINPALMREVGSELAGQSLRDIFLRPAFGEADAKLSHLLLAIKQSLNDTDDASQLKMAYLSRVLCVDLLARYSLEPISASGFKPGLAGLSRRQIALLQDYLETYLSKSIRIGDLASLCGISVTAFSKRFRASTGMTPHQYLIQMRLKKAKQLLATGAMPIAEIAIACGFTDQAHLTNVFGRHTGLRPSTYRKMS